MSRATIMFIASFFALLGSVLCTAQVVKANSEAIMDAAFDMKKAAEQADKLKPDGRKHCGWGISSTDAPDLDDAISRFLLNHRIQVPETLPASKLWRVSFVAGDLIHKLAMGGSQCELKIRYSDGLRVRYSADAHGVHIATSGILVRFMQARITFNQLAYQQTRWQEQGNSQVPEDSIQREGGIPSGRVDSERVLSAAREVKEAAEAARKVSAEATGTTPCLLSDTPSKPPDLSYTTKLVDYIERTAHMRTKIPATNIWGVNVEARNSQIDILATMQACAAAGYVGENKKARKIASEALQAYHRLTAAIAKIDALALQQTEWEEQAAQQPGLIHEQ